MGMGTIWTPWTRQPQIPVLVNSSFEIDTLISAVSPTDSLRLFRNVIGAPFSNVGSVYLSSSVNNFGRAVAHAVSGSNYFTRTRPWSLSGPRSFVATIVFDASSTTQGIWSIASTEIASSPHLLLQRNGSDLRIYGPGTGYVATFTGVAATGSALRVAWGYSNVDTSSSGTAYLAVNGELKSGAYAGGANTATNEFLFSGYSLQFIGQIGEFYSFPKCNPQQLADLSRNPWQIFQP